MNGSLLNWKACAQFALDIGRDRPQGFTRISRAHCQPIYEAALRKAIRDHVMALPSSGKTIR
jgi:hypothetical protein